MLMKQIQQQEQRIQSCKPIVKEIEIVKIKEVKYRDEARIKEMIDELNRLRDEFHHLQEEYDALKNRNN